MCPTLVTGLPTTGGAIWVRLSSNVDGGWQYLDYSYTAAGVPLFSSSPSATPCMSTATGR